MTIRRQGDVNVRRQPRYDSDKVGVAKAGRTYALLDIAENGWYHIRLLDGLEGYISSKLVQGQPEIATASRVIIRKSGNANVRQEADAASARVGVARAGRSYPLLSTADNGWYRILLYGGIVGYVSPKVVSRVSEPGENPDATPAPAATRSAPTSSLPPPKRKRPKRAIPSPSAGRATSTSARNPSLTARRSARPSPAAAIRCWTPPKTAGIASGWATAWKGTSPTSWPSNRSHTGIPADTAGMLLICRYLLRQINPVLYRRFIARPVRFVLPYV